MFESQKKSTQRLAKLFLVPFLLQSPQGYTLGLTVDTAAPVNQQSAIDQAANNVPIQNIARPNSNGLSHNKFIDYNVGSKGLIINNSAQTINTQLGGFITKNSHLANGGEARLILNEVTSSNRSRLDGFTEIAGRSASLILANPNGITCNGCGFINTPKATLTTGRPTLNNGVLTGLSVNQGDVLIEGLGLNANSTDAVEIMARAINVNAQINAKELQLIAGRNDITPTSSGLTPAINVTAKDDDGSVKPNFAIDSSSLGGMYANRIHLLATESGVGVNIAGDLAADIHEMKITANGQLVFKKKVTDVAASTQKISAAGDISLTSLTAGIDIDAGTYESLHGQNINLNSQGDISNTSQISSAKTLTVNTQKSIINHGKLHAGISDDGAGNITKTAQGQLLLNAGEDITNTSAAQLTSDSIALIASQDINNTGEIQADADITLQAITLSNQGGSVTALNNITASLNSLQNDGILSSNNNISLNVADTTNSGSLTANNDLSLTGTTLTNNGGTLGGGHQTSIQLTGDLNSINNALLFSNGVITVNAKNISTTGGSQLMGERVSLIALNALNNNGDIQSDSDLALHGLSFSNQGGSVKALNDIVANFSNVQNAALISSNNDITLNVADTNNSGTLTANNDLSLTGTAFVNNSGTLGGGHQTSIQLTGDLNNTNNALLFSNGVITVNAKNISTTGGSQLMGERVSLVALNALHNNGDIQSDSDLTLQGLSFNNQGGSVKALNDIVANVSTLQNAALISSNNDITLNVADTNNSGTLTANNNLRLTGATLSNSGGRFGSGQQASISLTGELNNADNAILFSNGELTLAADNISNIGNSQLFGNSATLQAGNKLVNAGQIQSDTDLVLQAVTLNNQSGSIKALNNITASLSTLQNDAVMSSNNNISLNVAYTSNSGTLTANKDLSLTGISLTNNGGTLGGGQQTRISLTGDLNNTDSAIIFSNGELMLAADNISNIANSQILGNSANLGANQQLVNAGQIQSDTDLVLQAVTLNNQSGSIKALNNITVSLSSLQNDGVISSNNNSTLNVTNTNNSGTITANNYLSLTGATLANNGGTLGSGQQTSISLTGDLNNTNSALLFSNGEMSLYANNTNNLDSTLFSQGPLRIAKNASLEQANSITNSSGNIESLADISLYASSITNKKREFEQTTDELKSGFIDWTCFDCGGDHYHLHYHVNEQLETYASQDSPASLLLANGNLNIISDVVYNLYSRIEANGDININTNDLFNTGSSEGLINRKTSYNSGRINDGTHERTVPYIDAYNDRNSASSGSYDPDNLLPTPDRVTGYAVISQTDTLTTSGVNIASIKAAGQLSIIANNGITQSNGERLDSADAISVNNAGQNTGVSGTNQNQQTQLNVNTQSQSTGVSGTNQDQQTQLNINTQKQDTSVNGRELLPSNGLFTLSQAPNSHVLFETNPTFTQFNNFINSDYLLSRIDGGAFKSGNELLRLGDGFYEQQYVRQQIFAKTGQRYLSANFASDQAQFVALMDNGVTTAQALNLSPGISLSATQVAALTSDILWLEEQTINGQAVLVPVVYLAQIDQNNLNHKGAVLAGNNVQIITGAGGINSSGSLQATNTLQLVSLGDITNKGQISAATVNISTDQNYLQQAQQYQSASINASDTLNLAAKGNVTSLKDILALESTAAGPAGTNYHYDLDAKSSNINGGQLNISAGKNIELLATNVNSTKDITLQAEGDITLGSQKQQRDYHIYGKKSYFIKESTQHLGSNINSAGNINVLAGNNVAINTTQLNAKKDISLAATQGDISIKAEADREFNKSYVKSKHRKTRSTNEDIVHQAASISGQNITLVAGSNIKVSGSALESVQDIKLSAKDNVTISSVENLRYRYFYEKKKKSFGRKKISVLETEQVKNTASHLNAGRDVLINVSKDATEQNAPLILNASAKAVRIIGSDLTAGKDIAIYAGDNLSAETSTDYNYRFEEKTKSGFGGLTGSTKTTTSKQVRQRQANLSSDNNIALKAGNNVTLISPTLKATNNIDIKADNQVILATSKDSDYEHEDYNKTGSFSYAFGNEGHLDETVRHTEITAGGSINIHAANDLVIEYKQNGTLDESINALSQLPELAWMGEVKTNSQNNAQWQAIQETHDKWQEHDSGIGGPGVTVVAIAIAIVTVGAGSSVLGLSQAAAGTLTTAQVVQIAVVDSLINQAAISLVVNKGDIGAVFEDLLSKEGLLTLATAGATAGITNSLFTELGISNEALGITADSTQKLTLGQSFHRNLVSAAVSSSVNSVAYGGNFGENLLKAAAASTVNTIATQLTKDIGALEFTDNNISEGGLTKILAHATVGCAAHSLTGGNCSAGALGAATAELLAPHLSSNSLSKVEAELVTVFASGFAAIVSGEDLEQTIGAGLRVERNNRQEHISRDLSIKKAREEDVNIPDHRANVVIRGKITDYPEDIRDKLGDPIYVLRKGYVYVLEDLQVEDPNNTGNYHLYPSINDSQPNNTSSPTLNDYIRNAGHIQTYQSLPDDFENENSLIRGYIANIEKGIGSSPKYPSTWETIKCAAGYCSDNFYNSNTSADTRLENASISVPKTGNSSVPGGFFDREGANDDRE